MASVKTLFKLWHYESGLHCWSISRTPFKALTHFTGNLKSQSMRCHYYYQPADSIFYVPFAQFYKSAMNANGWKKNTKFDEQKKKTKFEGQKKNKKFDEQKKNKKFDEQKKGYYNSAMDTNGWKKDSEFEGQNKEQNDMKGPMVQVYNSEDAFIGKMTFEDAKSFAHQQNLKLVKLMDKEGHQISACKLMTGQQQFMYEMKLKQVNRGYRYKTKLTKTLTIKHNITERDLIREIKKIEKYLQEGHDVQFSTTLNTLRMKDDEKQEAKESIVKMITEEFEEICKITKQHAHNERETVHLNLYLKKRNDHE